MSNITSEFHDIINAKSTSSLKTQDSKKYSSKKKNSSDNNENYDMFTKEAYRIYQHIDSLHRFLLSIRRAYLHNTTRKSRHLPSTHNNNNNKNTSATSLFSMFPTNITHLTDNERDEIDFQAKLIIRKCMDRIKELEDAELVRKSQIKTTTTHRLTSFLNQVIPGAAQFHMETEDILSIHHSNIIWLLNKLLTDVSKLQRDQQEIRLTRELEKSENHLFNSTAPSSSMKKDIPSSTNNALSSSPLGINWKPTKSTTTSTATINNNNNNIPLSAIPPQDQELIYAHDDMDAFEQQLSQEQIQLLEKENETMLEEMNGTLNQVKQAEKALLEISALQTQLTNHLAVQTMQTDQLYGDSLATNEKVEQGNLQLQQARERNRGTRKFMLAFLLGASFVLLFLDWYS
ncbi:hypothetical protein BJ944DRAFT_270651 [Cunninghamella echinulata]|nr:hypothetical protein BJ944DRAFT_270651 [Cunninghamella echinulata]